MCATAIRRMVSLSGFLENENGKLQNDSKQGFHCNTLCKQPYFEAKKCLKFFRVSQLVGRILNKERESLP